MSDIFRRAEEVDQREFPEPASFVRADKANGEAPRSEAISDLIQAAETEHLPEISTLESYERVLPGGAQRLLEMAEREQASRLERDRELVRRETRNLRASTVASSVLSFSILSAGFVLSVLDRPWVGGALCAASVLLAAWMVFRTRPRSPFDGAKRATAKGPFGRL